MDYTLQKLNHTIENWIARKYRNVVRKEFVTTSLKNDFEVFVNWYKLNMKTWAFSKLATDVYYNYYVLSRWIQIELIFKDDSLLHILGNGSFVNYKYCPVAFSISKTFEIPKIEPAMIGQSLHNTHKLLRYLKPHCKVPQNSAIRN